MISEKIKIITNICLKAIIIILIVSICFLVFEKYIFAEKPAAYRTGRLEDAYTWCGINWYGLNDKRTTTNYIHLRNTRKGHYLSIHKCNPSDTMQEDRYFLTSTRPEVNTNGPDMVWYMIKRGTDNKGNLIWIIYRITLENEKEPHTQILRRMLEEYDHETRQTPEKPCPCQEKKEKVNV